MFHCKKKIWEGIQIYLSGTGCNVSGKENMQVNPCWVQGSSQHTPTLFIVGIRGEGLGFVVNEQVRNIKDGITAL